MTWQVAQLLLPPSWKAEVGLCARHHDASNVQKPTRNGSAWGFKWTLSLGLKEAGSGVFPHHVLTRQ
jgi:hypothetical protein